MRTMTTRRGVIAALLLSAATGTAALGGATLILDDFDNIPGDDFAGARTLSTDVIANPFGRTSNFEVDPGLMFLGDEGALFFNAEIGVRQEGVAVWDNQGAGLGLDINAAGFSGFELDFGAIDQDFGYFVRLHDSSGGLASIGGAFLAGGARTESIALGDFTLDSFDATDVDSIEIVFNVRGETASLDFVLTEFRARVVPSSGSLALLALGGMLATRRGR